MRKIFSGLPLEAPNICNHHINPPGFVLHANEQLFGRSICFMYSVSELTPGILTGSDAALDPTIRGSQIFWFALAYFSTLVKPKMRK